MNPDDLLKWASQRLQALLSHRGPLSTGGGPFGGEPGPGARARRQGGVDRVAKRLPHLGFLAASATPVVGEAIDLYDIGKGLIDRDAGRVGLGALGLSLPFVAAGGIKRVGRGAGGAADDLPKTREEALERAKNSPDVVAAAVKVPGVDRPFWGQSHFEALQKASEAGHGQAAYSADAVEGYVDEVGDFLTRKGAAFRWKAKGRLPKMAPTNTVRSELFRRQDPDWGKSVPFEERFALDEDLLAVDDLPAAADAAPDPDDLFGPGTQSAEEFTDFDAGPARVADDLADIDGRIVRIHMDSVRDPSYPGGGSTVDPRTGENLVGKDMWAVSPYKSQEVTLSGPPTAKDLAAFRRQNADLFEDPKNVIGTWQNADGQTTLDVVRLYKTTGNAVDAAARADQDAIFHLGRLEERPITARERAEGRSRWASTKEGRRQIEEEFRAGLTPDEVERFEKLPERLQDRTLNAYAMAPNPQRLASVAIQGAPVRGWYSNSAAALDEMFGPDAPRFAALLAATSPQKSVEANLDLTMQAWDNWIRAGRPQGAEEIRGLIPTNLEADLGNAVRALQASDETLLDPDLLRTGGILSGPKVDPFYANLVGEAQRVVNDTHMARGFGTTPGRVGQLFRNLAQNATIRNTAREVTQKTGTPVTASEVQEMVWGPVRAMTEMSSTRGGNFGSAVDVIKAEAKAAQGGLPPDPFADRRTLGQRVKDTPSFASLLDAPARRALLQRIGVEPPTPRSNPGLPGASPSMVREADLLDIAQRVDAVRANNPFYSAVPLLFGSQALLRHGGLLDPERD